MISRFSRFCFLAATVILIFLFGCKSRWLTSQILSERRTYFVHLPQDYSQSNSCYPVLYMLDAYQRPSTYGASFFDKARLVDGMTAEGIPPMIIVGIKNRNRSRDMLPLPSDILAGRGGGADDFLSFMNEELIPLIDRVYRTSDKRILYGRSDSGLFALYALSVNPGSFSAYISSSPTVGHCSELLHKNFIELFLQMPGLDKQLCILYGEDDIPLAKDFIPDLAEKLKELASSSFRFQVDRVSGSGHIPPSSLEDGIRFVFNP